MLPFSDSTIVLLLVGYTEYYDDDDDELFIAKLNAIVHNASVDNMTIQTTSTIQNRYTDIIGTNNHLYAFQLMLNKCQYPFGIL